LARRGGLWEIGEGARFKFQVLIGSAYDLQLIEKLNYLRLAPLSQYCIAFKLRFDGEGN
jgi:hypothetical protein